ncbi:MAG: hypothetical protein HQ567_00420, partial [Candidatus Nealsonbacteria bacterium]|nr:hypothetical protein [Candidatus Nealsonbacteria bacterium]
PHLGTEKVSRVDYSLLEQRGGTFTRDCFDALSVQGGFLAVKGLKPGDYSLKIKREGRAIPVRVTAGEMVGRFAAGKRRILETANRLPMHVIDVALNKEGDLLVQLINADAATRVHLLVARFDPVFPLRGALGPAYQPPIATLMRPTSQNVYLSGRDIGDEHRYIIERRAQTPLPGNMLARPGLLLNPWAIRETDTGKQKAATGGEYADRSSGEGGSASTATAHGGKKLATLADPSNLDFLMQPGVLLANLVPDKNGIVQIAKEKLGERQDIHVVAISQTDAVFRRVSLADAGATFRDMRLARTLELAKRFTERKTVSLLDAGERLSIDDVRAAEMQSYDTLASVYALYMTRSSNPTLAEFGFVLNWATLTDEQKQAKYSKYASHELSFFLNRKDPEFFKTTILPYLKNKKDKTFLDHYLLGDDLSSFLDPWRYSRLNMAERVLLAHRLGKQERGAARRHLADLYALLPPNPSQRELLFATALRGRSLSVDESAGIRFDLTAAAEETTLESAPADVARMPSVDAPVMIAGGAMSRTAAPSPGRGGRPMARPKAATAKKEMADKKADMESSSRRRGTLTPGFGDMLNGDRAAVLSDLALRRTARGFYRKMPKVKEWAENNYHHVLIQNQLADLVKINAFWRDYAAYLADGAEGPFLSENVAEPTSNFSEMMLALAVLD